MKNYNKVSTNNEPRTELHDALSLTGAEVSINALPAGASVPFVHAHKQNEEIYGIIEGSGYAVLDGEKVALTAGDWLRVSPAAKRQFFASEKEGIKYVCIQVKANSLEGYTMTDAVL
ncbi:MAG: cupin domain-containing protein [Clostridiales bacterium]|nr:cupin domain-containing protein [Clostridiales bacterium]